MKSVLVNPKLSIDISIILGIVSTPSSTYHLISITKNNTKNQKPIENKNNIYTNAFNRYTASIFSKNDEHCQKKIRKKCLHDVYLYVERYMDNG